VNPEERMRRPITLALLVALPIVLRLAPSAVASAQPGAWPSAADLARDLQRRYEQVRDFSADFEHTYQGGVLGKTITERGTLMVRKPGMMRWLYTSPEKKEFVSDGKTLYSYVPEDRQVVVSRVPPADEPGSPALFLAGKGNILRDFTASMAASTAVAPTEVALKLVPTSSQRDYDWIVLVVDRKSLQIRRLVTADSQGGTSTFVFSRMRENIGIPDSAFAFRIPRGVDVLTDATSR
jgi:outer membrane lipoprotein carrier protein